MLKSPRFSRAWCTPLLLSLALIFMSCQAGEWYSVMCFAVLGDFYQGDVFGGSGDRLPIHCMYTQYSQNIFDATPVQPAGWQTESG